MADEGRTYKKRKVRVVTPERALGVAAPGGEEAALYVDDRFQLAGFDQPSGRYFSWKLPYTAYGSLDELADALIDHDLAD